MHGQKNIISNCYNTFPFDKELKVITIIIIIIIMLEVRVLLLLSVGLPVANAPDVLQPCGLLYYP